MSRKPPADYEKRLKPLLTPLKEVLARRGDFDSQGKDGVILLDETLMYTDASGRRVWAHHMIEEAVNESGAETLAEDTHDFRTDDQKLHLVLARSILKDGKEVPVDDRGVIMESAQNDSGASVYGDRGQMRLIFSAMKPGIVREVITCYEETQVRIDGHFTAQEYMSAYWPVRQSRFVLLMPDSVVSRVKETRLGTGYPEAVKSTQPDGTHLWKYEKERIMPDYAEGGRPPMDQMGPVLFLSTLADWETFGEWYRKLLKERSEVPQPLLDLAREWTKDAKTDQEKVQAIVTHVARDVRYTGLEFGLGALQPRSPEQVWKTAYGDCKDKSNLSALLLRSVGVEASLALIQTDHLGRIERRSPDTRHFNHAILAVKSANGWQFTDPTIRYVTPGMLAPSSCDRDVLLMKPDGIEWTRTPVSPGGEVHYRLDADFEVDGSIEGWLELRNSGYYLASERSYYESMGQDELKRDVQSSLNSLLPGARLIDVEKGKLEGDVAWRVFFTLTTQVSGNDERLPITFPAGGAVMLRMGDDEKRQTTRFLWPVDWRVSGSIRLPEGWVAADVPASFDFSTEAYEVSARWEMKDGACLPHFEAKVIRNSMSATEHGTAWRGTKTLMGWLQKPLWLKRGEGAASPAPAEPALTLGKFPLMPTGEGQLAFVEEKFPSQGNRDMRRMALRKVLEHFADDPLTVFMAKVRLALADWSDDKDAEAEKALRETNQKPHSKVDEETAAWGRYMQGLVLADMEKPKEAAAIFEALTQKASLSEYRRAWAFLQLSYVYEKEKDFARALTEARKGMALNHEEVAEGLIAQITFLLIELKQEKELETELKKLADAQADKATPLLVHLAKLADAWAKNDKPQHAQGTLKALEALNFKSADADYQKFMDSARGALAGQEVSGELQKELKAYLRLSPTALQPPTAGWPENREACAAAFKAADESSNSDAGHRLALRLLTEYPPDADFPRVLWRAASHLEHYERGPEAKTASTLLRLLIKLGKKLPETEDHHWEIRFLEGTVFEYRGQDWRGAAEHFAAMDADAGLPDGFRSTIIIRAASNYEKLKEWKKALEMLARLERWKTYASAGDGLARAAHLHLEMGEPQKALRLLRVVETSREFHLKNTTMEEVLTQLLDLAKDEKHALAIWQAKPAWWPAWQDLAKQLGVMETEVEPMVTDPGTLGTELSEAMEAKDGVRCGQIMQRLAHQARWVPGNTVSVSWLSLYRIAQVRPNLRTECRKFILTILRDAPVMLDNDKRSRFMYLAMCGIDSNLKTQALVDVHDYFKAYPKDVHVISFVMARLWALIAMEKEAERPAAEASLREHLASPELRDDRMASVKAMVDLLRVQKRTADLKSLLTAELKSPVFSVDESALAELKGMLRGAGETEALGSTLQNWITKHAPPWWAYAGPKTLADAGLKADEEDISSAVENLPFQEQAKVYILAAAERQGSIDLRLEWWRQGLIRYLKAQQWSRAAYEACIFSILDDPEAPVSLKDSTLRMAVLFATEVGTAEDYPTLRKRMADKDWLDDTRAYMLCLDRVHATDLGSNTSIAESLLAQVKDNNAMVLVELFATTLVDRALAKGKVDRAEAVTVALTQLRNSEGIPTKELQSLRLTLMKSISEVRRSMAMHEALEKVLVEHDAAVPKVKVPDVLGAVNPSNVGSAAYMAWMREAVRKGEYDRGGLHVWNLLGQACAEVDTNGMRPLRLALAKAVFGAAAADDVEDETRRLAANLILSAIDFDNAEEREFALSLVKPWRDPKLPETYAEIRSEEAQWALRTGGDFDFKAIQEQLKDAGMSSFLQSLALSRAMSRGDVPSIKRALDEMGADALLEHEELPIIIPALKKAGRKDELTLALEEAPAAMKEAILDSWGGNDVYAVRRAVTLAELLGKPDALPKEWVAFCEKAYPERQDQLTLAIFIARMNKDWEGMLKAATEVMEKYPTFYAHSWFKAKALVELKRTEEAKEPLRVYVKYCHDEAEHHVAEELLKKLESGATPQ
ncbi:DUF3857 and transglutaminase domain-containing protein [Brevifollis gellanilyticus]|uniref:DUF3857 and transglutaminase domain-containing protein n=1 Tax=Brevifollis gellanilyticus TaxID=748831 RepID=UPI0014781AA7|nr:DUF3857 and transglutaminase domain-containing protein [Brevifollis gellanilyticus]